MTTQHHRSAGPAPPAASTGSSDTVTAALNALAGAATPVPGEALDRILEHACKSATAVLRASRGAEVVVSVTELGFGRPHSVATDEAVRAVEQAQYAAGAGPGERAAHERRVVQDRRARPGMAGVHRRRAGGRLRRGGVGTGVRRRLTRPKVIGVIGTYTRNRDGAEFVDESGWWAGLELVTTAVSATLSESRRRQSAEGALARLRRAVSTREEVDRAVVVLSRRPRATRRPRPSLKVSELTQTGVSPTARAQSPKPSEAVAGRGARGRHGSGPPATNSPHRGTRAPPVSPSRAAPGRRIHHTTARRRRRRNRAQRPPPQQNTRLSRTRTRCRENGIASTPALLQVPGRLQPHPWTIRSRTRTKTMSTPTREAWGVRPREKVGSR